MPESSDLQEEDFIIQIPYLSCIQEDCTHGCTRRHRKLARKYLIDFLLVNIRFSKPILGIKTYPSTDATIDYNKTTTM